MEKHGLSLEELEVQTVELLPDRIEMRRRKKGRHHQDCDAAQLATGVLNIPIANNNAAICLDQKYH